MKPRPSTRFMSPLSGVANSLSRRSAFYKGVLPRLVTGHHGAGAIMLMRLTCAIVVSVLMTSCLDFGEDVEFFAPKVTAAHLEVIEKRTGIELPEGSVGMALYSNATGIDPWMLAKIKIPAEKVVMLRASKPFTLPQPVTPTEIDGETRSWWKPDELARASRGQIDINSTLITWTLGEEGNDHMLYLAWYTF